MSKELTKYGVPVEDLDNVPVAIPIIAVFVSGYVIVLIGLCIWGLVTAEKS